MTNEPHDPDQPQQPILPSALLAELKSHCERLSKAVQELEQARQSEAESLAAAQAELEQYRRLVYSWARRKVREEDWQDFSEDEYTITADEVIAELDRLEAS